MTNISQFPIETEVYLNDFSSDIFKSLDVDKQMSLSCGQVEPHTTYDSKFGSLLCDWNDGLSSTYGDYFDLQRFNFR